MCLVWVPGCGQERKLHAVLPEVHVSRLRQVLQRQDGDHLRVLEDEGGEWLYIARELQKNKSINRISKELGRRYKHMMRIAHMVMERVKTKRFLERLSGVVEMDEIYIPAGGKGTRCVSRWPRRRALKRRGHLGER